MTRNANRKRKMAKYFCWQKTKAFLTSENYFREIAQILNCKIFFWFFYDFLPKNQNYFCILLCKIIFKFLAGINQLLHRRWSFFNRPLFKPPKRREDFFACLSPCFETNRCRAPLILPLSRLPDSSSREASRWDRHHEALHFRARHRYRI